MNDNEDDRLEFRKARIVNPGGLFIDNSTMRHDIPGAELLGQGKKVYSYKFHGTELSSVEQIKVPSYLPPYSVPVYLFHRNTGRSDEGVFPNYAGVVQVLEPQVDNKGFPFFGEYFGLEPGAYRLTLGAGLKNSLPTDITPERYVLRLEFSKDCQRIVTVSELSLQKVTGLNLDSHFESHARVQPNAYWFGNIPVALSEISISKLSEGAP